MRAFGALFGLGDQPGGRIFAALVALPAAWALHWLGGFPLLALATGLAFAGAAAAARAAGAALALDRFAGQLLALWPLSGGLWAAGSDPSVFPWPGWVGGFLLCQAFSIWRPGPLSRLGPVTDDAAAGLIAAALMLAAAALAHGWLA